MDKVWSVVNQGWVGSLLSVAGLILAVLLYRWSRVLTRLTVQRSGARLIGHRDAKLPTDVKVFFRRRQVPRITTTTIVIWNSGTVTLRGTDIVSSDPLSVVFEDGTAVLDVQLARLTRPVTQFQATVSATDRNVVLLNFDFLDPSDGARVEILHTASTPYPQFRGTLRGLPKGLSDWGQLPLGSRSVFHNALKGIPGPFRGLVTSRIMLGFVFAVGLLSLMAGLFPDVLFHFAPRFGHQLSEPMIKPGEVSWPLVLSGITYLIFPGALLWQGWRRYPSGLDEPRTAAESKPGAPAAAG